MRAFSLPVAVFALALVALLHFGVAATAQTCCVPTDLTGCEEPSCEACVCALDSFCCTDAWDAACVDAVFTTCASSCSCVPPLGDGSCCETAEDGGGCSVSGCQQCVCGADPFCCSVLWDIGCVACASGGPGFEGACVGVDCRPVCRCGECGGGCGDGCCEGAETCESCPIDCGLCVDSCCQSGQGPGCDEAACEGCVCAADPFCCDVDWDADCVQRVYDGCAASCSCTGVTAPQDCCSASEDAGCADLACQSCVCGQDAFCCDLAWDPACAACASGGPGFEGACMGVDCRPACGCEDCGGGCGDGCCDSGETCESCPIDCGPCETSCCQSGLGPGCDEGGCESCVCALDAFCCDVEWDGDCVQRVYAECASSCACTDDTTGQDCCEASESAGCSDLSCQSCVCALDAFCCDLGWDLGCASCAAGGPGFDGACASHSCAAACPSCDVCGNDFCGPAESPATCPQDCAEEVTCPDGDVTGSGTITVVDVQCAIITALWAIGGEVGPPPACVAGDPLDYADLNCDGVINVVDVQLVTFKVLGMPLPTALDANGDGCVDACGG